MSRADRTCKSQREIERERERMCNRGSALMAMSTGTDTSLHMTSACEAPAAWGELTAHREQRLGNVSPDKDCIGAKRYTVNTGIRILV